MVGPAGGFGLGSGLERLWDELRAADGGAKSWSGRAEPRDGGRCPGNAVIRKRPWAQARTHTDPVPHCFCFRVPPA